MPNYPYNCKSAHEIAEDSAYLINRAESLSSKSIEHLEYDYKPPYESFHRAAFLISYNADKINYNFSNSGNIFSHPAQISKDKLYSVFNGNKIIVSDNDLYERKVNQVLYDLKKFQSEIERAVQEAPEDLCEAELDQKRRSKAYLNTDEIIERYLSDR